MRWTSSGVTSRVVCSLHQRLVGCPPARVLPQARPRPGPGRRSGRRGASARSWRARSAPPRGRPSDCRKAAASAGARPAKPRVLDREGARRAPWRPQEVGPSDGQFVLRDADATLDLAAGDAPRMPSDEGRVLREEGEVAVCVVLGLQGQRSEDQVHLARRATRRASRRSRASRSVARRRRSAACARASPSTADPRPGVGPPVSVRGRRRAPGHVRHALRPAPATSGRRSIGSPCFRRRNRLSSLASSR